MPMLPSGMKRGTRKRKRYTGEQVSQVFSSKRKGGSRSHQKRTVMDAFLGKSSSRKAVGGRSGKYRKR